MVHYGQVHPAQAVLPGDNRYPQTDRARRRAAQSAVPAPERHAEPVAVAALHIRHAHKDQFLEAGSPEAAADAAQVAVAHTPAPQACRTTGGVAVAHAVVAVAGHKEAGCMATVAAQIAPALVVARLLPVP